MREFHYSAINHQKWDSEILGLVAAIYKEAGKQELYLNYSRLFSIESASYDKQGGSIKVNCLPPHLLLQYGKVGDESQDAPVCDGAQ